MDALQFCIVVWEGLQDEDEPLILGLLSDRKTCWHSKDELILVMDVICLRLLLF